MILRGRVTREDVERGVAYSSGQNVIDYAIRRVLKNRNFDEPWLDLGFITRGGGPKKKFEFFSIRISEPLESLMDYYDSYHENEKLMYFEFELVRE